MEQAETALAEHKQEAQEALEHCKFATQKCKCDWKAIVDLASKEDLNAASQARLQALQESFTLVLSADYQMTKLVPFWGATAQHAMTYYMRKVSHGMPLLGLILRGLRKEQLHRRPEEHTSSDHPFNPRAVASDRVPADRDNIMLWAVCCVGFFGFFRSGELTAPENGQHLTFDDMVNDPEIRQRVSVCCSSQRQTLFILGLQFTWGERLVAMPRGCAAVIFGGAGKPWGGTFQFRDGRALTCSCLVRELRKALSSAGFCPEDYMQDTDSERGPL